MPQLDLERADRCTRAAADRLRKSLPASYPATPLEQHRAAPTFERGAAIVARVAEGAEQLLALAVDREREAREAQELAIEALRACGSQAASWATIGDALGISAQAAHKRYAATAEAARAELTIEDLETAGA